MIMTDYNFVSESLRVAGMRMHTNAHKADMI